MIGTIGLALLAGVLSVLSPCVLPLVPIVLGTAASEHRFVPSPLRADWRCPSRPSACSSRRLALRWGSTPACPDGGGAPPRRHRPCADAAWPAASEARRGGRPRRYLDGGALRRLLNNGPVGPVRCRLLLGAVWSPCVGPTLGAASVLAARGENLGAVALTMLAFGVGAALPLLGLGLLSRDALMRWRNRMMAARQGAQGRFLVRSWRAPAS